MRRSLAAFVLGLLVIGVAPATAADWQEGKHYFKIEPTQANINGPGLEVVEVFSYGCPACSQFRPTASKIKAALPEDVHMMHVPASFRAGDAWELFQRIFYTAQALGIDFDTSHAAIFDAVTRPDGELSLVDAARRRPITRTLDEAAQFFRRFDVSSDDFLATANSFAVNTRIKQANAYVRATGVDSTPSVIVAGKYRLTGQSAGGWDKVEPLVLYLIERERGAAADLNP